MVSIIIPAFNSAHLVSDAIASVLNQNYANVEIIVVDDGSTDHTGRVVQAIAAKDARVAYEYQANQGLGGARNAGIARATGELIAFLDADDLFLPNKLSLQVQALEQDPTLGLVAGGHHFADVGSGQILAERRPWQHRPNLDLETWLVSCPVVPCAVLVRADWVRRVGGFAKLQPPGAEDRDLWLRLSYAGCRMAWTPEIVCAYRLHLGQMTRNGQAQHQSTLLALHQFFGQPNLRPEASAAQPRAFAEAYLSGAFREYGANQVQAARDSLAEALSRSPELLQASTPDSLPMLAFTLMAWAREPYHNDPLAFAERVLAHLPPAAQSLAAHRERILMTTAVWAALDAVTVDNAALAQQHWRNASSHLPELTQSSNAIIEFMSDYLEALPNDQQIHLARRFFEALPSLQPLRNKALARLLMARAFKAHASGATHEARQAVRQGVQLDQAWLRNRGVLSMWVKSWFA
jgi:hypothetical protein